MVNNNNNNERYLPNINTNEHYYKLAAKEASRLLLDFDHLKKTTTDEDLELAYMISYVLQDRVGIQNGCSLAELTVSLLYSENDKRGLPKDGDDKFFEEEHYLANKKKVLRAIDLIKRMSLEALVKGYEKAAARLATVTTTASAEEEENRILELPFYVCSAYSKEHDSVLYFNFLGRDKNNEKERLGLLNQLYSFLGFADIPKDDYCITPKGLGIVRFNKSDNVNGGDNSENTYDMTDEEIDDIFANVQGNYTSEIGFTELTNLATGCLSLLKERASAGSGITEEELMYALIPESVNTLSSSELAMYMTKIKDALYFINRMYYPSPKYDEIKQATEKGKRKTSEKIRFGK